jgi:hypothetical protein
MIVVFLKSCWLLWALLLTSISNGDYDLQMQFYVLIVWIPNQNKTCLSFCYWRFDQVQKVAFKNRLIAIKSNNQCWCKTKMGTIVVRKGKVLQGTSCWEWMIDLHLKLELDHSFQYNLNTTHHETICNPVMWELSRSRTRIRHPKRRIPTIVARPWTT